MAGEITILVADRSRAVLGLFQRAAAQPGRSIMLVEAEDGRACSALLERGDIDLAFIDLDFLEKSVSKDFVAAIARRKDFVTIMSGPDKAGIFPFAEDLKAADFLVKPFGLEEVESIIAIHLRLSVPVKILIVDPSPSVRKIIGKVLAGSTYRLDVEEAETDAAAVALCRRERFAIVFLDCPVEDASALETLQRLLEVSPGTKFVLMSVERNRWQERLGFRRGAAAFLHKPFYPTDIAVILHRLCVMDLPQVNGDVGSVVADYDVRVQGRTVSAEHRDSGHVYQFLWFRDPPYLRSAHIKESGAAAATAALFRAEAERAAVAGLRRAALLNAPVLESLAG